MIAESMSDVSHVKQLHGIRSQAVHRARWRQDTRQMCPATTKAETSADPPGRCDNNQLLQQQRLQFPTTPKLPQVAALRDGPAAAVSKQNNSQQSTVGHSGGIRRSEFSVPKLNCHTAIQLTNTEIAATPAGIATLNITFEFPAEQ